MSISRGEEKVTLSIDLQQAHAQLAHQHTELAEVYFDALRKTLFNNRVEFRPATLKPTVLAEAKAVMDFFLNPDPALAAQRGAELCRAGLGEEAIVRLMQVTPVFLRTGLTENLRPAALSALENYARALLASFIRTREAIILEEQERIRGALEKTIHRYTFQLQMAAEVARAATSTLDLNELLQRAAELIRKPFDFYYVGLFLAEANQPWAILSVSAREAGQTLLQPIRRLKVGGDSLVGKCLADRQPHMALDVNQTLGPVESSLLPGAHSEIALPLLSHGKAVGALTLQSRRVSAFSDQDIPVLRIIADQLAGAIENARLFAEARANLEEAQTLQRQYLGEAWASPPVSPSAYLYEHSQDAFLLADELSRPEMEQALQTNQVVRLTQAAAPPAEAALAVPIMLRGQPIGIVDLYDVAGPREWTEEELALTATVASQAALALENARLHTQLEARVEERTLELSEANRLLRLEVTERKRMAEALRDSEMRFRSIAQSANDAILSADSRGHLLFWNRGAQTMFGYGEVEMLDRPLTSLVPERYRELFPTEQPAAGSHSPIIGKTAELYGLMKDGREFPMEISLATWKSGAEVFYGGIIRDITERKATEQVFLERALAWERTRALEQSNRELEQFAYAASHDLQEPLRKIQAFGDRLKAKYSGALDEQGNDFVDRMQSAAARMQNLINDLLAYSRVTTKTRPFGPVELAAVVKDVLSDLETRLEQTGGQVTVGELPTLEADSTQMHQLLQNLIGNALKFHKEAEAPHVKVYSQRVEAPGFAPALNVAEAGEVALEGGATGRAVCQIFIEDNGIGFDEKYLDRIFTVFQRLHGRNEYEGTGIGLAICRRIVERHGGEITAKSTPDQGATFIITLPLTQPHEQGEDSQ